MTKKKWLNSTLSLNTRKHFRDLKLWINLHNTFPLTTNKITFPLTQEQADFIFTDTSKGIDDIEDSGLVETTYVFSIKHLSNVRSTLINMGFNNKERA